MPPAGRRVAVDEAIHGALQPNAKRARDYGDDPGSHDRGGAVGPAAEDGLRAANDRQIAREEQR